MQISNDTSVSGLLGALKPIGTADTKPGQINKKDRNPTAQKPAANIEKPKPAQASPLKKTLLDAALNPEPCGASVDIASTQRPNPQSDIATTASAGNNSRVIDRPLSLQGLAKSWGGPSSTYDFTGDGTVDVQDLLYFINNWDKLMHPEPSPGPPVIGDDSTTKPADRDASIGAASDTSATNIEIAENPNSFSASNPNSFSTANLNSFSAANPNSLSTANLNSISPAAQSEAPATVSTESDVAASVATNAASVDENASVATLDRSRLIAQGAAARAAVAARDGAADLSVNKASINSLGGLSRLSQSIYDQLSTSGFAAQPPTNIRELIDQLNLAPRQSDFVLKQLAAKYPDGLGINETA